MRKSLALLALMPALAAAAPGERCGGFEARALQKKSVPLLGGRLMIQPLQGARPGPASDTEPVGVFNLTAETQRSRFTLVARELFQRAGEDFVARAKTRAAADERAEPFTAGGLSGVMLVPQNPVKLHPDSDEARLLTLFVSSPDGTMQQIDVTITRGLDGCLALAKRMLATLLPGARKLDLSGGARQLRELAVSLAPGQAMYSLRGPDFDVYTIQQMVPFPQRASLGIYLGHHPQRMRDEGARREPGRLFGKAIEFLVTPEGSRQAIASVPGIDRLLVHVFFEADDPAVLRALQATAETLRAR